MAVRVFSLVWDGFQGDDEEKIVLLAIADACSDDGSIVLDDALIARKCSLGIYEARKIIKRLTAKSFLISGGDLPGGAKQYRVAIERFTQPSGDGREK